MTIWIIAIVILILRETVHSNLHTLQLTQSNQPQLIHIPETLISNHNPLQSLEPTQPQLRSCRIETIMGHSKLCHCGIQCVQFTNSRYNNRGGRLLNEIRMILQCPHVYESSTTTLPTVHIELVIVTKGEWQCHIHETGHILSLFPSNWNHLRVQCCAGS